MSEADKLEIVKSWFKKAENDLVTAEHIYDQGKAAL
jgi:hypothetical protein